jgi:hypothetical protein
VDVEGIGLVPGVDVLIRGGMLELCHHLQVIQAAIFSPADGRHQLLH